MLYQIFLILPNTAMLLDLNEVYIDIVSWDEVSLTSLGKRCALMLSNSIIYDYKAFMSYHIGKRTTYLHGYVLDTTLPYRTG